MNGCAEKVVQSAPVLSHINTTSTVKDFSRRRKKGRIKPSEPISLNNVLNLVMNKVTQVLDSVTMKHETLQHSACVTFVSQ